MAAPAPTRKDRAATAVMTALLLAGPAVLIVGAGAICPTGDCWLGAVDSGGLALAARGHGPFADAFFRAITWAGSILVLGPLALAQATLAWYRLRCRQAWFLPAALAGASLMAYAAKVAVSRERPDVVPLIDMPSDASFPSAHTLQASAFVLAWLLAPGRGAGPGVGEIALGMVLIALVAWSRLHLQVHYPSDILFGLAAGVVWVVALRRSLLWRNTP